MKRLTIALASILMSVGIGTAIITYGNSAAATTPKFNNSTDTVHCGSFTGKAVITPALKAGGTSATTIKVTGVLDGCSDATGKVSGSTTADTVFSLSLIHI